MLFVQFLIFSIGTFLYTKVSKKALTEIEAWSFFPVLIIFYAAEYFTLNKVNPELAPWISLGSVIVILGLYSLGQNLFKNQVLESKSMLVAFSTVVVFHSAYLEILPIQHRPWLFPIILILFAMRNLRSISTMNSNSFLFPMIGLGLILIIEYITLLFNIVSNHELSYSLIIALVSVGSLWIVISTSRKNSTVENQENYLLLASTHVLAIASLYRLTADIGSLAVSTSWLGYALAVMCFAYIRKDEFIARSAVFVLSVAAGKALLYDAASAATEIRILCLLLTGVVLYGAGFVLRKISNWKN